jgi:two-component system sensor histidine kinase/response regulator
LPACGSKEGGKPADPAFFARNWPFLVFSTTVKPLARFLIRIQSMNNVLVIDDTDEIRSLIGTVLRNFGFTVREAANGQQGIKMITEEKPDLVICDVNMPGMGGYETLAAIRASSQTATIPFILMTGLVSRDGFRRGMVCGADDYLVKPFTPNELVEAVMSRLVRQSEVQLEANKRAQRLHEYAANCSFPELAGNIDDTVGSAVA